MDTADLEIVISVKSAGSFASAARARGIDPSIVSRTVSSVEKQLGVRLFHRSTRKLLVTEAGEAYIEQIEPLLDELSAAAARVSTDAKTVQGTVRLSAPVSIGRALLLPHLEAFRSSHPEIMLECYFDDRVTDLVGDGIDVAVRMAPSITGNLICTYQLQTRYRVVATPDWLAKSSSLDDPSALTDLDCILFTLPGFRDQWAFRCKEGSTQSIPVKGKLLFSNGDSVVDAMLDGLGPALLVDALIEQHLETGRCVDQIPNYEVTATTFDTAAWIVYPSKNYMPKKTRAVIDFIKEKMG